MTHCKPLSRSFSKFEALRWAYEDLR